MSDWKNVQYKDGKMRTNEGGGGGSSTFSGLEDVSLTNLQNGQVPKYNSNTQKWENEENSLANLSDTSMLTLSDKQVLSYNGRTQKWENRANSVSRLSDVSLNSPSDGDILCYNAQSGEWENAVMPDSYHVYSTTEHIIGEWIDGRLIYEKTWDFGSNKNISNNSWTTTTAQKSGIAFLISCECATENGGACWSDIAASIEVSNTYIALQCMRNGDTSNVRYMTLRYLKS